MAYEVGQHIDLTYLNKKAEAVTLTPKNQFQEAIENEESGYDVGTQLIFNQGKMARRIQVNFA